jgi:hypothetical protein
MKSKTFAGAPLIIEYVALVKDIIKSLFRQRFDFSVYKTLRAIKNFAHVTVNQQKD